MEIGKVDKYSRIKQTYDSSVEKKTEVGSKVSTENDTVEISQKSHELSRLQSKMATTSEVRVDKVEELKHQVESGEYEVDSEKVSEKIVDDFG